MRVIIITAAAVLALAIGVAVASTQRDHRAAATPPVGTAQGETWDQRMCEEATKRMRAEHPDMYIGGCNHGSASIGSGSSAP